MFKRLGTDPVEVAVPTTPVVERFDVIEHIRPGQITGFVDAFLDALFLQTAEEAFCHRIVPAVTTPTWPILPQHPSDRGLPDSVHLLIPKKLSFQQEQVARIHIIVTVQIARNQCCR